MSCAAIVLVLVKVGFELLCIYFVEGAEEQYIYIYGIKVTFYQWHWLSG